MQHRSSNSTYSVMEKILFSALLILGALFLSSRCEETPTGRNAPSTDSFPQIIDVHVVDHLLGGALDSVLVTQRKANAEYYLYQTNSQGNTPPIVIHAGDTLVFSRVDRSPYYLVLEKPDSIKSLQVYLQGDITIPGNADTLTGVVRRSDPRMSIVNLADPMKDITNSDALGKYRLDITTPIDWIHVGYANDTTIVVINAGPGTKTKLDVFFDDSKLDALRRRQN
jgi:hypothetical protein